MPAKLVTGPELKMTIASQGLYVVDVYADWCGPCKMLAPILDQVADEQNVAVLKLNSDNAPAEAMELQVQALPTVIIFKDGKEVERFVGFRAKPQIEQLIAKHK